MDEVIVTDIHADLKSDRLNDDVILFMSSTLKELLVISGLSMLIAMSVGISSMLMVCGSFTWGLPIGIILFFIIFLMLSFRFSQLKRDKPAGYYQQYILIKLSQCGIVKSPYVMRSGKWSTERRY